MSMRARICLAMMLALSLGWFLTVTHAQDAGPAESDVAASVETAAPGDTVGQTSFVGLLKQGGPLMWPLGVLSVATIALAIYGFMIVPEKKMLTPELVPSLQEALNNLDLEEAGRLCRQTPSMLTNTLHAGLQRISDGILDVPSMEKAMEEASVEETASGLKTISYLSIIAQIAPMLGLLGTVSGMIKAFQKIGLGGMGKPEVLAGDIGEAMVTTATGLIIGVPAMVLYFVLKSKYTSNVTRLGRILGNLSHHLVASSRRASGETSATPAPAPAAEESAS